MIGKRDVCLAEDRVRGVDADVGARILHIELAAFDLLALFRIDCHADGRHERLELNFHSRWFGNPYVIALAGIRAVQAPDSVGVRLKTNPLSLEGVGHNRVGGSADNISEARKLPCIEVHTIDIVDSFQAVR